MTAWCVEYDPMCDGYLAGSTDIGCKKVRTEIKKARYIITFG